MRTGLTPRQAELLTFIRGAIKRTGIGPTRAEMATAIGICSKGAVASMIDRLEDRGFVQRIPNASRSISVVEKPGIPPELDERIAAYCRQARIPRHEFDRRAAESFIREARSCS